MSEKSSAHPLAGLSLADWHKVVDGKGVLIVDDLPLGIGAASAPNAVIDGSANPVEDAA